MIDLVSLGEDALRLQHREFVGDAVLGVRPCSYAAGHALDGVPSIFHRDAEARVAHELDVVLAVATTGIVEDRDATATTTMIGGEGGLVVITMTGMIEDVEDLVLGTTGTTIRGKARPARIGTRESIGEGGLHPRMRTRTVRRPPN